jgi:hypothetical protein
MRPAEALGWHVTLGALVPDHVVCDGVGALDSATENGGVESRDVSRVNPLGSVTAVDRVHGIVRRGDEILRAGRVGINGVEGRPN